MVVVAVMFVGLLLAAVMTGKLSSLVTSKLKLVSDSDVMFVGLLLTAGLTWELL